jgi:TatA/E family protein of Tat protein translocase
MLGSIGFPELLLILVIALLLFGPKKLPEIGKTLGRSIAEFKKATNDLKRSLEEEVDSASNAMAETEKPPDPLSEKPKDPYKNDEPPAG